MVKRIIRYVSGFIDLRIWYSTNKNSYLVGFSDVDWAGDTNDRKSTSRGRFFVGNNVVSCIARNKIVFPCPLLNLNTLR